MIRSRLVAILTALVALLGLAVLPASAHASLVSSDPPANAILDKSPARLTITFSEAVEPGFSQIRVLRSDGAAVDRGDSRLIAGLTTVLGVSLGDLEPGTYTVAWRALSAVDGHITQGSFPFSIGQASTPLSTEATTSPPPSPLDILGRWLSFASAAALAGGFVFRLLALDPALNLLRPSERSQVSSQMDRRLLNVATIAIGVLLVGSCLSLLGQALALAAAPGPAAALSALFRLLATRYGEIWGVRVIVTGALSLFLSRQEPPVRPRTWLLGLVAGLGILLTMSLSSHSAALRDPFVPTVADWIHLIAAAVWAGGLLQLALFLVAVSPSLPERSRARLRATLVMHFSTLAAGAVGAIAITGLYSASIHVGSWDALVGTAYGRTLLIKVALILPLLALGALNLLFYSPRLAREARRAKDLPAAPVSHFEKAVLGEVALVTCVLLATALLTSQASGVETVAGGPQTLNLSQQAGDPGSQIDVQLILQRLAPGQMAADVVVANPQGQPVSNAREVSLRFSPLAGDIGASSADAQNAGAGHYRLNGGYLGLTGAWQIEIAVRRPNAYDVFAAFRVLVQPNGQIQPFQSNGAAVSPVAQWVSVYGRAILAALCLVAFFMWAFISRRAAVSRPVWVFLLVPGVVAMLFGVSEIQVFLREYTPSAALVNPTLPDANSIARAKPLYQQNCQICHGPAGRGDGPQAAGLNPPPADFTGGHLDLHTDGDIFYWIQHGIGGSAMPAFQGRLSDAQTWDLVNYVRRLRAQSQ